MLEIGVQAPEFTLPDQNGKLHSLSDYRGKKVILYFYPKDMTGGCTSQACNFRDRYPQIQEKGAVVLGVSKDSVASHKQFEEKHGLPFPLLADEKLEAITAYDVLKPGNRVFYWHLTRRSKTEIWIGWRRSGGTREHCKNRII